MKTMILAAMATLAMVIPAQPAAASVQFYVADATAVIDISAEGLVEGVQLTGVPGEAAAAAYEQQIRAWRFEPIVEDGVPVPARTHAQLRLVAQEAPDGGFSLTMRKPIFRDPPGTSATAGLEGLRLVERRLPRYPMRSQDAGLQAEVILLIEISADGAISRAGVHSATLLNTGVRARQASAAARPFVDAARRSVLEWRFEPSEKTDRRALVPVSFTFHGSENSWQPALPLEEAREQWVRDFYAARESGSVEEFQPGRSERFALLDLPEQPWL